MSMDQVEREGMRRARRQFDRDAQVRADALNAGGVSKCRRCVVWPAVPGGELCGECSAIERAAREARWSAERRMEGA